VDFHPDGSYALVLTAENKVHVVDWATKAITVLDVTPPSGDLSWDDVVFDPTGAFALLVALHASATNDAVVYKFDDAAWRAGAPVTTVLTELTAARRSGTYSGVAWPWSGGSPVLLRHQQAGSFFIVQLHQLDPSTGVLTDYPSLGTGNACQDLAFATSAPGQPAIFVACANGDSNGRYFSLSSLTWTDVGPITTGSIFSTAAHTGGDYALAIDGFERRVRRFQNGVLTDNAASISFPTHGILHVAFQPGGARALIVGLASGSPLRASVLEYRHDLFTCPVGACAITDVSIPNFASPPYNGGPTDILVESAWRPGCDGGLMVGGNASVARALLIEFGLAGGVSCAAPVVPLFADGASGAPWLAALGLALTLVGAVRLRGRLAL
jgi:hypothetical protein